jgi:hypothetical protein
VPLFYLKSASLVLLFRPQAIYEKAFIREASAAIVTRTGIAPNHRAYFISHPAVFCNRRCKLVNKLPS